MPSLSYKPKQCVAISIPETLFRLLQMAALVICAPCYGADQSSEGSLCQPGEKVYFDCQIAARKAVKHLSLCGSALSEAKPYLQYRFGVMGGLELEFPERQAEPGKHFYFSHYGRYQVSRTSIRFSRHNTEYRLFDSYEADAGPAQRTQGVEVSSAGKSVTLNCIQPGVSSLGELQNKLPCDQNDALNLGECP